MGDCLPQLPGREQALQPQSVPVPAAVSDAWDQAPRQAEPGAFQYRPRPKYRDTSTNPDNGVPKRHSTNRNRIPEPQPPAAPLPQPAAELGLHRLPAAEERVYNPDCRKICRFRQDLHRGRLPVPEHGC